ncbi:MAG: hypothetical protein CMO35_00895 [Verrucomicrobiaceae bacterium]|nr:hypothetical protein [Verrucomicrobiaceae bacterium]
MVLLVRTCVWRRVIPQVYHQGNQEKFPLSCFDDSVTVYFWKRQRPLVHPESIRATLAFQLPGGYRTENTEDKKVT